MPILFVLCCKITFGKDEVPSSNLGSSSKAVETRCFDYLLVIETPCFHFADFQSTRMVLVHNDNIIYKTDFGVLISMLMRFLFASYRCICTAEQ